MDLIGDNMKKILIASILMILIPALIVTIFERKNNLLFKFKKNSDIRIKQTNGEIIKVPFEEYIVGVISAEMGPNFEPEALKAQAVAARSYALTRMKTNMKEEYDVVDTVTNQVYLNENSLKEKWKDKYEEYLNKIKKVVNETSYEYLEYKGDIVEALFFSTSTGKTENVEEVFSEKKEYLRSVDSSFDSEVSPVFEDFVELSKQDFFSKLGLPYNNVLNVSVKEQTSTGRIKQIDINGNVFKGTDVTSRIMLRSNYFTIIDKGENVRINTKGFGHGVGMSQYGAEALAKKGYSYDKILKHYYTGVEIKKLKKNV